MTAKNTAEEKAENTITEVGEKDMVQEMLSEEPSSSLSSEELLDLSLEALLERAQDTLMLAPKAAIEQLTLIQPLFQEQFKNEKKTELAAHLDESEVAFVFSKEQLLQDFNQIFNTAQQSRKEEKERIEQEKQSNYKAKLDLLDQLKSYTEQDETEDSINQVKAIQKAWKKIKVLPHDKVQGLWDNYHRILDTFYDNHSINIELKELDRKKNLEAKIELTKKVEAVVEEQSLKKSFILLNKYHDDFKHIGPVPQESREGIWKAFKAASDHVYKIKRAALESLHAKRDENLKQKKLLLEKANVVAQLNYESLKDWNSKTKAFDQIFEDWKKVGPVPQAQSDKLWNEFKSSRNLFYHNKKQFFHTLNKERNANLKAKEVLCEKVEALQGSTDFQRDTPEILKLQKEWKQIGPVPDKVNQAIWKRFRTACDHFFNRKDEAFAGQRAEEESNQKAKEVLLEQLNQLQSTELTEQEVFEQLKQISSAWRKIGFVPKKSIKRLNGGFEKLTDNIFKKYKKNRSALKASEWEEHYTRILSSANGDKRLSDESYRLKKKLTHLNEEVQTYETNMSFFAKSSSADKLLKDFEQKLNRTRSQIDKLKAELNVIKKVQRTAKKLVE